MLWGGYRKCDGQALERTSGPDLPSYNRCSRPGTRTGGSWTDGNYTDGRGTETGCRILRGQQKGRIGGAVAAVCEYEDSLVFASGFIPAILRCSFSTCSSSNSNSTSSSKKPTAHMPHCS